MKIKLQLEQAEAQEVVNALMQRAQGIAALAERLTKQANEQLKVKDNGTPKAD